MSRILTTKASKLGENWLRLSKLMFDHQKPYHACSSLPLVLHPVEYISWLQVELAGARLQLAAKEEVMKALLEAANAKVHGTDYK